MLDQRIGPKNTLFAQRLHLGWVVIGEACLGKVHRPDAVSVKKTYLLPDHHASIFSPCNRQFSVKECPFPKWEPGQTVFESSDDDEKIGLSMEDRDFLYVTSGAMEKSFNGNWIFPLPFRSDRLRLQDNRIQAVNRAKALECSLYKDHTKKEYFVSFMGQLLEKGHAELAPPLAADEECLFLPILGVYHPKSPDQIRVVFDLSAKHQKISLNDVLYYLVQNSLLGILLRFWKEKVAVTACRH